MLPVDIPWLSYRNQQLRESTKCWVLGVQRRYVSCSSSCGQYHSWDSNQGLSYYKTQVLCSNLFSIRTLKILFHFLLASSVSLKNSEVKMSLVPLQETWFSLWKFLRTSLYLWYWNFTPLCPPVDSKIPSAEHVPGSGNLKTCFSLRNVFCTLSSLVLKLILGRC